MKDRSSRSFSNWYLDQLFHQVNTYSRWLRVDNTYMSGELAQELETVTLQDVQNFIPQVLSKCHTEVLAHGNLYEEEALKITDLVEQTLKPSSNFVYKQPLKDPANVNHCIEYTLYLGDRRDVVLRAKQFLLSQILEEPAFNQLRTIEQLGYVVFSGSTADVIYAGFEIVVQSERDCGYLEGQINRFLIRFEATLKEMSEDDFEKHKAAVISERLESPKNLQQEYSTLRHHIAANTYDFEQANKDAAQVATITKADMLSFYAHHVSPSSPYRAKLSVHLVAQAKSNTSVDDLKQDQEKNRGVLEVGGAEEVDVQGRSSAQEPVLIEDVKAFKDRLARGAVDPVRSLEKFLEQH